MNANCKADASGNAAQTVALRRRRRGVLMCLTYRGDTLSPAKSGAVYNAGCPLARCLGFA